MNQDLQTFYDLTRRTRFGVLNWLETFNAPDEPFTWTSPSGYAHTLTRRWLILHPITHEFHHKGQALALARVLGHPHPGNPDTDLVEL